MNRSLQRVARRAAAAPSLLLAVDYDGTLAPLVTDPSRAVPNERALRALIRLAELPDTEVAIVTGRDKQDLLSVAPALSSPVLTVVASHGADAGSRAQSRGRDSAGLARVLRRVASEYPGVRVEQKSHGAALHTRGLPAYIGEPALASAVEAGKKAKAGRVIRGNQVVEITSSRETKGDAVLRIMKERVPGAVIYIGDDTTDEDVFVALRARTNSDTIKVGPGKSSAKFRVASVGEVASLLEAISIIRAETWAAQP